MRRKLISLLALTLALSAISCIPGFVIPDANSSDQTTTIIIVRHTERDPGLDPPLNTEGFARAQALRDALSENGVDVIYTTDLLRNRQSVEPLATELGITVNLVNPALYVNTVTAAQSLVSEFLTDHAGKVILFCGNRGSVIDTPGINESIYRELGGTGREPERYQDMYVLVVPPDGSLHVTKAEYGGPSSLD